MQARYYDPVIGRFYSNDPVGYTSQNPVMSFNRYLYVNNNPYKYTDPNGEFLDTILDIGFIAYDLYDMATNGVNATNSASLTANIAGALIPGATGLGLAARAADKGVDAANGARQGADFIATADGAVAHNSTTAVRESLEGAGMNGVSVTNKAGTEAGTIHNVPDMKMDVRVMDGGPNHQPRIVTSRQNSSQPVNPANGSNFGNVTKTVQRGKSHIEVDN